MPRELSSVFDEFYYCETSPTFLRHARDKYSGAWHKVLEVSKHDIAGHIHKKLGYAFVTLNRKTVRAHRLIMLLHGHDIEGYQVDHLDGNKINNAISNLRVVSNEINSRNTRMSSANSSGISGVTYHSGGTTRSGYFASHWYNKEGKLKQKYFSITKLGIMTAFRDAVIFRAKMIEELNAQGAGYTERHGKTNKF